MGLQKLIYELNKEVAIYKNRIQEKNTILSAGSIGIQVTGFERQCSVSRPVLNAFNGTVDYHACILRDDFFTVQLDVQNNLNNSVKDYTIACNTISQSGTVLAKFDNKVFSILEPAVVSKISISVPATPQTQTLKCSVSNWIKF